MTSVRLTFSISIAVLSFLAAETASAQSLTEETVAGLYFRDIGPVTMSGRVVDLAVVESDPAKFYVASATGGVWKTTDNGIRFTAIFADEATHSVGAIAVHQVDTNVVWVGTGERASRQSSSWGDGVYKSTDGGDTWTNMGLHDSHHIGRIAIHPSNSDIVFVAAMGHLWGPNEERGLYRSMNGGATWERVLSGDENTGAVDVAIDPSDPSVMYAAMYQRRRRPYGFHGGGPGSGLYKSTDGGSTWRELTRDLPAGDYGRIGISIYRTDPNIVYVSVEQGWRYNASTAYTERRAGIYRSEDKGESFEHMSDWNPRPMYASQILVDPSDDQRIYMLNRYSFSDDGGRTFTSPRQSLHGDDRLVWVNPNDSRHVMKADDGGLGISYDRGLHWLYATHLPISQWYRISYDMREPYWVYGGLQDNGSWMGPNANYRAEGILLDEWIRTGGGDGFVNYIDTTDNRTLYTESQYLGLSRLDIVTHQRQWIRPGDSIGAIADRRNWDAWGLGISEPELGNAMAPANWDGPFFLSPHNTNTIYAGTNQVWKSTDRGSSWTSLGDLTTGVNRRELRIMGERAHDSIPSLDDGIPYYPTVSVLAESPLRQGLLYAGTDDGNVQVSRNDGADWSNVTDNVPGLHESSWISGVEPSRHDEGTVYLAVNNYRNNDFTNYLYRSTDYGTTWNAITGNLPADRVLRTVKEDPTNADVLYLGSELGLFYTNDGGANWVALGGNLPTVAVNDLTIHPRDNDLIIATHGRGVWILDNIAALQTLSEDVLNSDAHLFEIQTASAIRYSRLGAHTGDMIFRGTNPPAGAVIDYYVSEDPDSGAVAIAITDEDGNSVAELDAGDAHAGINRIIWNLRHSSGEARMEGPWVLPGRYTVQLSIGGNEITREVVVENDPRIEVSADELETWHALAMELWTMGIDNAGVVRRINERAQIDPRHSDTATQAREVQSRLMRLYSQVVDWPGNPTADQQTQRTYLRDWTARLARIAASF
ncbi:MAG: hypothetical protein OEY63_00325 [Gemmatimonadota bacterium]|nr:hypothetical protein [Gemmatimonadota bacterium]